MNLVSAKRCHLLELATTTDAEEQVISRVSRSSQLEPVCTGTMSHCIDAWNPVDSIQSSRRSSSGKMTIDKWEKYLVESPKDDDAEDINLVA